MDFTIIADAAPLSEQTLGLARGKLIALDGAADELLAFERTPLAVVGDFDSVSEATIKHFRNLGSIIQKVDDQNTTDLDKGILFCLEQGATNITIINALGGTRVDHSLMNYRSLRRHYYDSCRIRIREQDSYIEFIRDSKIMLRGQPKMGIALFAAPRALVTSDGLEYDMNGYVLDFGFSESVSNSLKKANANVEVTGNVIVVYDNRSELLYLTYS